MFTNFGVAEAAASMKMLKELRNAGVAAEIYPDASKMKKQMGYADNLAIPFVAIVGETEMEQNKMMLKNMTTGEQSLVSVEEAIEILKK